MSTLLDCVPELETEVAATVGAAVAVVERTVGEEVGTAVAGREVAVGRSVAVADGKVSEGALVAVAGTAVDVAGTAVAFTKAVGLGALVGTGVGGGAAHETTNAPMTTRAIRDQFDHKFIMHLLVVEIRSIHPNGR